MGLMDFTIPMMRQTTSFIFLIITSPEVSYEIKDIEAQFLFVEHEERRKETQSLKELVPV